MLATLVEAAAATAKVWRNGHIAGSGFLVKLPILVHGKVLRGLMTNNHVLDRYILETGATITFQLEKSGRTYQHQIKPGDFRFTCPLIDVTFIELSERAYNRETFLETEEKCTPGSNLYITQYPGGGELSFAQGKLRQFWGFDMLHEVSTEYGSSGSPVINRNGCVVGVHKARRPEESCNVATRIGIAISAIRKLIQSNRRDARFSVGPAKQLTRSELQQIDSMGLRATDVSNVFIYPGSYYEIRFWVRIQLYKTTPMWFYRTNHAWYRTPGRPKSLENLGQLQMCDWTVIGETDPVVADGGCCDGKQQAPPHVQLVNWLSRNGMQYL